MSIDQRINELAVALVESIENNPENYGLEDGERIPDEVLVSAVLNTTVNLLGFLKMNGNIENGDMLRYIVGQLEDIAQI